MCIASQSCICLIRFLYSVVYISSSIKNVDSIGFLEARLLGKFFEDEAMFEEKLPWFRSFGCCCRL